MTGAGRTGFRTVVFDLDGTLIDSEGLILESYRHTMRCHLGKPPPDEKWRRTIGRPLVVQVREFARSDQEAEAMIRTYTEELRERGIVLAIATSKRRVATGMGLAACDLPEEWFSTIVTADDVARFKPDAEPVLRALTGANEQDVDRAVYVGDSIHDMQSGRAAGVRTAAVLWGPNDREVLSPESPDLWLERPADIPLILATG